MLLNCAYTVLSRVSTLDSRVPSLAFRLPDHDRSALAYLRFPVPRLIWEWGLSHPIWPKVEDTGTAAITDLFLADVSSAHSWFGDCC